jgi:hypothetical protein
VHRTVVLVCGLLVAASSLPHALAGWPALAAELRALSVGDELIGGLAVGWWFGSASFVAMGIAVLLAWRELVTSALAWKVVATVGAALAIFGAGALAYRRGNPHFLGFLGVGVALVAAAWRARAALHPQGGTR